MFPNLSYACSIFIICHAPLKIYSELIGLFAHFIVLILNNMNQPRFVLLTQKFYSCHCCTSVFFLLVCRTPTYVWLRFFLSSCNDINHEKLTGYSSCRSMWLSRCKILYYTIFSWLYGLVGSCAHLVMVNSSWTRSHIVNTWKVPERTKRVYPPCNTSSLQVDSSPLFFSFFL